MERWFSSFLADKGKIGALFEISRPWNGIVFGLISLLGFLFFQQIQIVTGCLLFISFLLIYMAGTTLNDVFDFHIDKINMPYRPLQSGRIGKKGASFFSLSLYFLAIILSIFLGIMVLIVILILAVITLFYSMPPILLSRRGILGNITLSICTVLLPALGGGVLAIRSFFLPLEFWISFISITIMFTFITITKDFKDIKGDRRMNKKTFVLSVGHKKALMTSVSGTLLFYLLISYLFFLQINNIIFYALSFVILVLFISVFLKFSNLKKSEKLFSCSRGLMLLFILLLFAFLL